MKTFLHKNINNFILFILGAILAPIGDIFHVFSHTTIYPSGSRHLFGLIPIWVPLQFGLATIIIGRLQTSLSYPRLKIFSFWECTLSALSLILCYSISGYLPFQPWFSLIAIFLACLINYYLLSDPPNHRFELNRQLNNIILLQLACFIALAGSSIEVTLIHYGVFSYTPNFQQFFSVPYWLPLLYIHASITVGAFSHYLENV